jgi:hypothetical protein
MIIRNVEASFSRKDIFLTCPEDLRIFLPSTREEDADPSLINLQGDVP